MPPARLLEVEIETAVALTSMAAFYRGQLGFDQVEASEQRLRLRAGATLLSFVPSTTPDRQPLYHFAFNIPRNKILAARDWHLKRASLIPAWGDLAEPGLPPEVVHFRHWNAQSLFFFDPAHNIVEYIARHSLATERGGDFSADDLLCVSEIGLMVDEPAVTARLLHTELGLDEYPPGADWWAMGDESGLLLCLQNGRLWGEHTETPVRFAINPVRVAIRHASGQRLAIPGYPFTIESRLA